MGMPMPKYKVKLLTRMCVIVYLYFTAYMLTIGGKEPFAWTATSIIGVIFAVLSTGFLVFTIWSFLLAKKEEEEKEEDL